MHLRLTPQGIEHQDHPAPNLLHCVLAQPPPTKGFDVACSSFPVSSSELSATASEPFHRRLLDHFLWQNFTFGGTARERLTRI
nr:hypothetical protein CFP56_21849 [Quercus suber]